MNKNVAYKTDQLVRYFANNRITWQQFYESERVIIQRMNLSPQDNILDIGCGCGGLGLALKERFGIENYTGVEINAASAEAGKAMNPKAQIHCGDILDLSQKSLRNKLFNAVFSLSCVDWNVCFSDMLSAAWKHVLPGGHLIATFRLTLENGCRDPQQSYQFINYDGIRQGEQASYVVLNAKDLMKELNHFNPSEINAYGYWGAPSATAVTPYERLCFAAFSIRKRKSEDVGKSNYHFNLPKEISDTLALP